MFSSALPLNGTNTSLVPNKSSLFAKTNTTSSTVDTCNDSNSSNTNNKSNSLSNATHNINITSTTTSKVVPNHGKPNCAPKPPGKNSKNNFILS